MIRRLAQILPTVGGRLTTASVLILAIVVGLWPDHARQVDPAKVTAIAAAAIAWLFAELAGAGPPSPHDLALHRRISEVMTDGALDFLWQHDFSNDLPITAVKPVHEIVEWHGPRYDFVDGVVQRSWEGVRADVHRLSGLYNAHLGVPHADPKRLTAHLLVGDRHDEPEHVRQGIRDLNEAASALHTTFDGFERTARRRLLL